MTCARSKIPARRLPLDLAQPRLHFMVEFTDVTPFFARVIALQQTGEKFVSVTLVQTIGSVPQDAGSKMIVRSSGLDWGTVGGGRVEAKAIALATEMLDRAPIDGATPRLVEWTLKGDVGMTCGGAVKLYFEPHIPPAQLWQIAIFGAGHLAQALVPVLTPLSCGVRCYDTRPEWLDRLRTHPAVKVFHRTELAHAVDELAPGTFIVCMTQGHSTDLPVLARALSADLFPFVGAIGSDAKAAVLRRELLASGLSPDLVQRLHCPLGLDFGTNHPHEIALSIAGQLLTERDRWLARANAGPR